MRLLRFLFVLIAVVVVGDIFLYGGQYRNDLWRDVQLQAQKLQFDVRRAIGL